MRECVVSLVVLSVVLAGCGQSAGDGNQLAPENHAAMADSPSAVVRQFVDHMNAKDLEAARKLLVAAEQGDKLEAIDEPRTVTFLGETINGDIATVTVQVEGRKMELRLRQENGQWRLQMKREPSDDDRHLMARAAVTQLGQALEMYVMRADRYAFDSRLPKAIDELVTGPADFDGEWEPLVRRISPDPWGRPFLYEIADADAARFTVACLGADGQRGGEGVNADITYPRED